MTKIWHGFLQKIIHKLHGPAQSPVFWVAVHAVIFLCIFINLSWIYYTSPTPGAVENILALNVLEGQMPYSDFACEYPPLALLVFIIPALFFRSLSPYFIAFATEIFLFDLLAMALIVYISRRLNISTARSLTAYTLFIAIVAGPIVIQRYDLVPAVLVLAALAALIKGKNNTAWAVLALSVMAKLYPLVVAPLFVIWHIIKGQYRQLVKGATVFLAVIFVIAIPWVIIDAQGFWISFSYHLERGLHAESSYGSFILIGQLLGLTQVEGGFSYGSYNLISPLADNISGASFYIMAAMLIALYLLFAFQLRKRQNNITSLETPAAETESMLLRYTALAIIVFLLSSKVFSIQYMIWLCPLLPLLHIRRSNLIVILLLIAGALTLYIYPFNYTPFARFETTPVIIMASRNFLLLAIGALILFSKRAKAVKESS
jgi:uncharacterized membrane protein